MSSASTPTESSHLQRAESSDPDVVMLDSEDTAGSLSPSSYTTASGSTAPAHDLSESLPKSVALSPFFRLPKEVRQQIYALSLLTPWPIPWPSESCDVGLQAQLLRVCRPMYEEAVPMLYRNTLNFVHPSDANMFLYNHNPETARRITKILLNIRDRDLRPIWTSYLSSTSPIRSLLNDYPHLHTLHITFSSRFWDHVPGNLEDRFARWTHDKLLKDLCMALELKASNPSNTEVKILVGHALRRTEIERLMRTFHGELGRVRGGSGEVRTRWMGMMKVEVALELSPIEEFEG